VPSLITLLCGTPPFSPEERLSLTPIESYSPPVVTLWYDSVEPSNWRDYLKTCPVKFNIFLPTGLIGNKKVWLKGSGLVGNMRQHRKWPPESVSITNHGNPFAEINFLFFVDSDLTDKSVTRKWKG
jgi:hypothetical protein